MPRKSTAGPGLSFNNSEQMTFGYLFRHVPIKIWVAIAGVMSTLVVSSFGAGVRYSNLRTRSPFQNATQLAWLPNDLSIDLNNIYDGPNHAKATVEVRAVEGAAILGRAGHIVSASFDSIGYSGTPSITLVGVKPKSSVVRSDSGSVEFELDFSLESFIPLAESVQNVKPGGVLRVGVVSVRIFFQHNGVRDSVDVAIPMKATRATIPR